jgi:hypothetical protein
MFLVLVNPSPKIIGGANIKNSRLACHYINIISSIAHHGLFVDLFQQPRHVLAKRFHRLDAFFVLFDVARL